MDRLLIFNIFVLILSIPIGFDSGSLQNSRADKKFTDCNLCNVWDITIALNLEEVAQHNYGANWRKKLLNALAINFGSESRQRWCKILFGVCKLDNSEQIVIYDSPAPLGGYFCFAYILLRMLWCRFFLLSWFYLFLICRLLKLKFLSALCTVRLPHKCFDENAVVIWYWYCESLFEY